MGKYCRFMLVDVALGAVVLAIVARSSIVGMVLAPTNNAD
jgi:hypothetical protein